MKLSPLIAILCLSRLAETALICENDAFLPPTMTTSSLLEVPSETPNLVDIKSEVVDGSEGVKLTIIYSMSSKKIKDIHELYKYIVSNISYINFELSYYEDGLRRGFNCLLMTYEIESSTKMITVPVQFPSPLKFYQIYRVTTSYYLKNSQKSDDKDSVVYETCFGVPNKPTNIQSRTLSRDCDLEISWKSPAIMNAPKVCYYFLKVTSFTGEEIISKEVYDERYVISGLVEGQFYNVALEATNDVSCYRQTCSRQCYLDKLQSGFVQETIRCCASSPSGLQLEVLLLIAFLLVEFFQS
jgi:hypothetical protein